MKFFKIILLISLVTTNVAFAKIPKAKKTLRKPNQVETMIHFKVVYGEKTTFFVVTKNKNGGSVDFSNNLGSRATKEISSADYDYLKSKISNLPEPSNQKVYCVRNYIEIVDGSREILGCLGAPNKLAIEVQETVNLLSVLF